MFNLNKSIVVIFKVSTLAVALVVAGCSNQGVKTDKITYHTSPAPTYKDLSTFPKNNSWLAEINTQKVPVDVDTAANRLKKYYKFPSAEEVTIAKNWVFRMQLAQAWSGLLCQENTIGWGEPGTKRTT
ncbi:hypothetical protein [Enterobacter sp. CP102]|uniref:hypothetical protein n=1 Tax=Enterobacter sp. CP102 TaxID=2976431 RepID=UPI00220C6B5D|nr:hypothetical protein [Enterobacter sp. CP102]UWM63497.1 hypothetical protein N1249_18430 [Enterobacter sp. CP102]